MRFPLLQRKTPKELEEGRDYHIRFPNHGTENYFRVTDVNEWRPRVVFRKMDRATDLHYYGEIDDEVPKKISTEFDRMQKRCRLKAGDIMVED